MAELFIQGTTIVERAGGAHVEMGLSDANSATPEATETIRISVEVTYTGHPRLIEVQKLALQRVREIIGGQILWISSIQGRPAD